ncbi:MAG TPA: hypothetical protein VFZ52_18465 [Chryseolinea sp.]
MNIKDLKMDQHSVYDVMCTINPPWTTLEPWFHWPADVFLLTSLILKKTGAYRSVLLATNWKTDDFLDFDKHSVTWLQAIQTSLINGEPMVLPTAIANLRNNLEAQMKNVKFTELKALSTPASRELSILLIQTHALADQSAAGFGIPRSCDKEIALVHCLANLLLVNRGSLSSVPKFHGVVLPKMRTPQTGLTLRSFSLQMSYHDSEVEVMWRSVPWMNKDQNAMNIMCVPWPTRINASAFQNQAETFESIRYFGYEDSEEREEKIGKLVSTIKDLNNQYDIHVIAFPEMSLCLSDYNYLLSVLKQEFDDGKLKYMPMVIAGVNEKQNEQQGRQVDKRLPRNTVRLAVYFSGKWYDMSQTKHHRWKLTRNQLIQYELSGRFSTERSWFEHVDIEQRRLSFFVPNGWLALCPLICEDLAQLEPVSEIIRSLGPTLLIALLMDGPQIKERWPARYASIFADDPGTAVLTMTSLGMVERSIGLDNVQNIQTSFALWKDQVRGWKNVDLGPANTRSKSTAVVSISASFTEEFTADGRSDGGFASVFKLDNIYYPEESKEQIILKGKRVRQSSDSIWFGDWTDLRELSSVTYAMDALISLQGHHWPLIRTWLYTKSTPKTGGAPHPFSHITSLLLCSNVDSSAVGIESGQSINEPTPSMKMALKEIDKLAIFSHEKKQKPVEECSNEHAEFKNTVAYWTRLYNGSVYELEQQKDLGDLSNARHEEFRIQRALYLAVLMSLHNRIDYHRTKYKNRNYTETSLLFEKIETAIMKYSRFKSNEKKTADA